MLEPAISRRSHLRSKAIAAAFVVGCSVVYMWIDRPVDTLIIQLPAHPIVITVPARPTVIIQPAPPAPPAPPPEPPKGRGPIAETTCPTDVGSIGVPLGPLPENVNGPPLVDVAVSRDGCTLAARTASAIEISWDGGKTFAHHELAGLDAMVAVGSRVIVQRAGELGTIAANEPITWRVVPAKLANATLLAAGKWTVLAVAGLAGVSDDDGASWRYLDLSDISVVRVDVDGRVFGTRTNIVVPFDGEGNGAISTTHLAADVHAPTWKAITTHPGHPADDTGRYALEPDKFWGCGGSEKLAWVENHAFVATDLRADVWPIAVRTTGKVTFASLQNRLVRLERTNRIDIGDMPGQLAGVDASGAAIVQTETQVLRWSKAGGWRVLFDSH